MRDPHRRPPAEQPPHHASFRKARSERRYKAPGPGSSSWRSSCLSRRRTVRSPLGRHGRSQEFESPRAYHFFFLCSFVSDEELKRKILLIATAKRLSVRNPEQPTTSA